MKMNTVEEIIERVKDIISIRHGERKPLDKDVAQYLGITPKKLSIYKCANKMPYEELSRFCYHERVSIRWILFCEKNVFYFSNN